MLLWLLAVEAVAAAAAAADPGSAAAAAPTGGGADEAAMYLPCFDSDPAFAVLKPRQQFSWTFRPGQVKLLPSHGSWSIRCLTATTAGAAEGALHFGDCLPGPDTPSQNWTTVLTGAGADQSSGLAAPSGFTVCGDVPNPGAQVNTPPPTATTAIPVQRNFRAWVTSPKRHNNSSPGGACLSYDLHAAVFRSTTVAGEQGLCLSIGPGIRPCE